jgi:hypothetical protein
MVQNWLQEHGYEPPAGESRPPSAAAAGGSGGGGGGGAGSRASLALLLRQQQPELLHSLRLLMPGVPLIRLELPGAGADDDEGAEDDHAAAAAAAADGVSLPLQLGSDGCFGVAWQLAAEHYEHLPAAVAALEAAAAAAKQGLRRSASVASAGGSKKAAGAGAVGAGPADGLGFSSGRGKRARVLREGALTMIPYEYDEASLWLKRVHTFLGAVRLGVRACCWCGVSWGQAGATVEHARPRNSC